MKRSLVMGLIFVFAFVTILALFALLSVQSEDDRSIQVLPRWFKTSFSFSTPPLMNHSSDLTVTVSPVVEISDVKIEFFKFPAGIKLESGELQVSLGNMSENETAQHTIVLKVANTGNYRIGLNIKGVDVRGNHITQTDGICISVTAESAVVLKNCPNGATNLPQIETVTGIP